MRLLPRKHVLQNDWLVHLFALMSVLFPVVFLFTETTANPWHLAIWMPLFLVQWYHGFWQSEKHVPGHYFAISALATWAMYLHWSGAFFFFYGQVFLLKLSKLWMASIASLALAIWVVLLGWYWQYPLELALLLALLIVLKDHANYVFFRQVNAQRDRVLAQEELEYVTRERERERIARDLHDVLGHTLSSISLKAELAEKLLANKHVERAQQELTDIAQTARTTLADVRQTVTGYRSGNFRSELTMAQHSLNAANIQYEIPEQLTRNLSRELENLFSLVLRESITNVIRHAQAKHCQIRWFNKNRHWHLVVEDDGIGWQGEFGNGLTGMKERLATCGGKLSITRLEQGTQLNAVVEQFEEENPHARH